MRLASSTYMLGLQHRLMVLLPHHQVMVVVGRSIAQAAVAAAADHKGKQDWGILGQGKGLEVALVVVVMVMILVLISLHEREGSRELAHVNCRHGTERNLRSRS